MSALDREYYLHFAGHKEAFEIEQIYERHAALFERATRRAPAESASSRARGTSAAAAATCSSSRSRASSARRRRPPRARSPSARARSRSSSTERHESYRQAAIVQANEPDPERRRRDRARPQRRAGARAEPASRGDSEQAHELSRALGWRSYRAMYAGAEGHRPRRAGASDARVQRGHRSGYRELVEPAARRADGDRLRLAATLRPAVLLPGEDP